MTIRVMMSNVGHRAECMRYTVCGEDDAGENPQISGKPQKPHTHLSESAYPATGGLSLIITAPLSAPLMIQDCTPTCFSHSRTVISEFRDDPIHIRPKNVPLLITISHWNVHNRVVVLNTVFPTLSKQHCKLQVPGYL